MPVYRLPLIGLLSLLATGCVGNSQPIRHYVLQDGQPLSSAPANLAQPGLVRVGVGPISLPRLLNRPQLVVRLQGSEVRFEEQHQWGGRLQEDITQLLTAELQRLHPKDSVYAWPTPAQPLPQRQWAVDIAQLDGQPSGEVTLQASCRLLERDDRQPLWQRSLTLKTQAGPDMADYVDAQRQLLRQLAAACRWSDD